MNTLLIRSQPVGVIVLVMCAFALAYGMDHSRTPSVHIRVSPPRDVAPSQVNLRVSAHLTAPVAKIAWDYEGDGIIDAEGSDLYSQSVTYSQAGHFMPKVIVTDEKGKIHEGRADVFIDNREDLQAALNERWKSMWQALAHRDINGAVSFVASKKREVMRHDWTVMGDQLGNMAHLFDVPLQLTDGQGYRVVAKSANPLPMGNIQYLLEVEFIRELDNQWYVKSY
ncbi:MAG: hypothetical protein AB7T38_13170 [Nitrospirales bacterium]